MGARARKAPLLAVIGLLTTLPLLSGCSPCGTDCSCDFDPPDKIAIDSGRYRSEIVDGDMLLHVDRSTETVLVESVVDGRVVTERYRIVGARFD